MHNLEEWFLRVKKGGGGSNATSSWNEKEGWHSIGRRNGKGEEECQAK